jgi:hypothetical protein
MATNEWRLDDAEKGIVEETHTTLPPLAHIDSASKDVIVVQQIDFAALASPGNPQATDADPKSVVKLPARPKKKVPPWVLFQLWFNTYRKFFIFVTLLNLTGIILASLGRFPYAENHLGALVLGNLLMAILMRNELFLRILYTILIYGLRGVR